MCAVDIRAVDQKDVTKNDCKIATLFKKCLLWMMMASRDIASMHLFLEMKRIFPELPEDVIRKNIHEWQDDHKKCLQHLRKEREKHRCPRQSFSEYLYTQREDSRSNNSSNSNGGMDTLRASLCRGVSPLNFRQHNSARSSFHKGIERSEKVIFVNSDSHNQRKRETVSMPDAHKTQYLSVMYKNHMTPTGRASQSLSLPLAVQRSSYSKKLPSATNTVDFNYKTREQHTLPDSFAKQHKVTLSFTPSLSHQQKIIIPEPNLCASTCQKTSVGRHITSIHLELQPDVPETPAVKISAASNSSGLASNKQKYDSCIHISFTSRGATFSAQRVGNSNEVPTHHYRTHINSPGLPNVDKLKTTLPSSTSPLEPRLNKTTSRYPSRTWHSDVPNNKGSSSVLIKPSSAVCKTEQTDRCSAYPSSQFQPGIIVKSNHASPFVLKRVPNENENHLQPYMQAVIHHQKLRLEVLKKEFRKEKSVLCQINEEIKMAERLLQLKRSEGKGFSLSSEIMALKMENNKLKEECRILSMVLRKCKIPRGQHPGGS